MSYGQNGTVHRTVNGTVEKKSGEALHPASPNFSPLSKAVANMPDAEPSISF